MTNRNLFVFVTKYVSSLGMSGRGVIIVRKTPLEEITKEFDEFLKKPAVVKLVTYTKEVNPEFPNMVLYRGVGDSHIIFGTSEEGWKGDYGLTHMDVVVSVY
jgi:hypothetical protein